MLSFFKKKADLITDIHWLGVDIHSHILPGIDDGAKDLNQSLKYIKEMEALGFEKLLFTPHIYQELYPNTSDTILSAFIGVNRVIQIENSNIEIGFAAEYMIDYNFKAKDSLLTLPDNHLLIEMSYLSETPNIEEVIFQLQVKGYKLILAHPERYNFYHKNVQRYHRLREMGCLFQLNILSITGYYGQAVKEASDYLIKSNLYDLAATDLHHDKHLDLLTKFVRSGQLFNTIGKYEFKNRALFA